MDEKMIGQWGGEEPGQPSLVLWAGGRVSGSDGCNRLMGSWRAEGDGYLFSQMASTMMYCQGVDTWLSRLASAREADGQLIVCDAGGLEIGRLAVHGS
ncbi:META domain-containing protein [Glutamicibacter protophormiae]